MLNIKSMIQRTRCALLIVSLALASGGVGASPIHGISQKPSLLSLKNISFEPKVGLPAPDFSLRSLNGVVVHLSEATALRPVVLITGSYSCPSFRMGSRRFDELAERWRGRADFYVLYLREAHPRSEGKMEIQRSIEFMQGQDRNRDGMVTRDEYRGSDELFNSFDIDHDGTVRSHELALACRLDDFKDFEAPVNYAERIQAAKQLRREVPGVIPLLVDELDGRTTWTYGRWDNSAFVIARGGVLRAKLNWAAPYQIEETLIAMVGRAAAPPPATAPAGPPDFSPIAAVRKAARHTGWPVLVEFTAPGCSACLRMESTMSDPRVRRALGGYAFARVGIEHDDGWGLFDALDLWQTPAFVLLGPKNEVLGRLQGLQAPGAFLSFLGQKAKAPVEGHRLTSPGYDRPRL